MINVLVILIYIFCFWRIILFVLLSPIIFFNQKKKKGCNNIKKVEIKNNHYNPSPVRLFVSGFMRYSILKIGYLPSHKIRIFLYKSIFQCSISKDVIMHYGSEIRAPEKLNIGKGSIIGDKCILDARNGLIIGESVNISSNVSIYTEQHDYNDPNFSCNTDKTYGVIIHDRAWIGPNVIILPRVVIGEGAVVGAGAVVTKNVEPYSLYCGIPAKKIGDRNKNLIYTFDGKVTPFY